MIKARTDLTEEECYLVAILTDLSGIDIAEFLWYEPGHGPDADDCYRAYHYQWAWWRDRSERSIDQGARSIGKCLARGSLVRLADGSEVPIEDLVGTTPDLAQLNGGHIVTGRAAKVYASGRKEVYRVLTSSGRAVVGSRDHRILTPRGWVIIGELTPGDFVAIAGERVIAWNRVADILPQGTEDTFDIEMESTHNFIANDIIVHNSESINVRAHSFVFNYPGQEMVIIAPEHSHVAPIVDRIEARMTSCRLMREMTVKMNHKPFNAVFKNAARIYSRLPKRDGSGVKGIHPVALEADECLPAGTLITTKMGQVPIEDVEVGDMVLTHRNRWREVTATATRERPTVLIEGTGHPGMVASENHPFWATEELRDQLVVDQGNLSRVQISHGMPEWVPAKDLEGHHWSSPTTFPRAAVPGLEQRGQRDVLCDVSTPEFMWVAGLWVAEGCTAQGRESIWSIHAKELPEVLARVGACASPTRHYGTSSSENASQVRVTHHGLAHWLPMHFGKGSHGKTIPMWALGLERPLREALFEGVLYGDGCEVGSNWKLTTVSKKLAISFKLLAQSLDYFPRIYWNDTSEHVSLIRGRRVGGDGFYQVVANREGKTNRSFVWDNKLFSPVRKVTPTGKVETLYDLTVNEDCSFIADGDICHNCQDLQSAVYKELPEVVRFEIPGAYWRLHGVSKGLRDEFYAMTQPGSGFKVQRITAMSRPYWTAEDREQRIKDYGGSENSPDFKRNVWGVHGDAVNRVFHLHRLMKCQVRKDEEPEHPYHDEYHMRRIIAEDLVARAGGILEESSPAQTGVLINMLDLPARHTNTYGSFWVGMDVGLVGDPSEILVFAEYEPDSAERNRDHRAKLAVPPKGESRIKLVARLQIKGLPAPLQADAIFAVIDHYHPLAFSMDSTGLGLPIFQELQKRAGRDRFAEGDGSKTVTPETLTAIKGYKFNEKVFVGIDEDIVEERGLEDPEEILKEAGIRRLAVDWATDVLRDDWIDAERFQFPDDEEVLKDFNGQTWQHSKDASDPYGRSTRRVYGGVGGFHILDAARMAALGWKQGKIEAYAAQKPTRQSVPVFFG